MEPRITLPQWLADALGNRGAVANCRAELTARQRRDAEAQRAIEHVMDES